MSSVLEYPTYDKADECLDGREALERYRTEKARNPKALVTLRELHCGEHWKVDVYATQAEREKYLRRTIQRIIEKYYQRVIEEIEKANESATSSR